MVNMGEPERQVPKRRSFSSGVRKHHGYTRLGETYQPRMMKRCMPGPNATDGSPITAPGDLNPKKPLSKRRVHAAVAASGPLPSGARAGSTTPTTGRRKGAQRLTGVSLKHYDGDVAGMPQEVLREPVRQVDMYRTQAPTQEVKVRRNKDHPLLGLTIDENLVVVDVMNGTAAAAAGFEVGRKLQTIDGEHISSQNHAIAALRAAGNEINVGLAPTGVRSAIEMNGVAAGVQTGCEVRERRSKRHVYGASPRTDPLNQSPRPAVKRSHSAGTNHVLGLPGVGVLCPPWGDENNIPTLSPQPRAVDAGAGDPYKPNLYIPSRLSRASQPPALGTSNKTTLELAAEGQADLQKNADAINIGGIMRGPNARGRLKAQMEAVHNEISRVKDSDACSQVRQRRMRAASPQVPAAVGAPMGYADSRESAFGSQRRGKRAGYGQITDSSVTLHENGMPGSSVARSHSAPAGRRSVPCLPDHGDIITNPPSNGEVVCQGGRRKVFNIVPNEHPRPVRRSFTPSLRHAMPHPAVSDIHHQQPYKGDCVEFVSARMGKVRGNKNAQTGNIYEPPPQTVHTGAQSPGEASSHVSARRGKGLGYAAPPQPSSGYTPWGQRY